MTIDFDFEKDGCVTIRERDSMQQVRMPIEEVADAISDMVNMDLKWAEVHISYSSGLMHKRMFYVIHFY